MVVRSSTVLAAYKEPFAGWNDSTSGFAILFAPIAMSIRQYFPLGSPQVDSLAYVPADYCSNGILVATAFAARTPEPEFNLIHQCCSMWGTQNYKSLGDAVQNWVAYNPGDKQVLPYKYATCTTTNVASWAEFLQTDLKLMLAKYITSLPIIGNKKTNADIEELMKARKFIDFTFEIVQFMFL
jgi:hypothetical protein